MTPAGAGVGEQTARRLLAPVARAQDAGRVPALVGGVVRDGTLVWCDGRGALPGDPADTQFRIGSITKTFTAVLLWQLITAGTLTLDQRLGELLPARVLGESGAGDRTVRELLGHTGGLAAEPAGDWWERAGLGDTTELAGRARQAGARAASTRGRQHYSNLAYGLLGQVAARAYGQDWWSLVRQRLLAPLGMHRTTYAPASPHAQGYSVHPWTSQLVHEPHSDTGAMAPAGQLWSTAGDLARWVWCWQEGHREVLPASVLQQAATPQPGDGAIGLAGQGLGFQLSAGGSGTLVGHTGSMPGFQAVLVLDRPRATAALALGNATEGMPSELPAELLAETERCEPALTPTWSPPPPPPGAVLPVLGVWYWGARVVTLGWEAGEVVARSGGRDLWRFVPDVEGTLHGTTGHHAGEVLSLVRDDTGEPSHLAVGSFVLTRQVYDPAAPIPGGPPPAT